MIGHPWWLLAIFASLRLWGVAQTQVLWHVAVGPVWWFVAPALAISLGFGWALGLGVAPVDLLASVEPDLMPWETLLGVGLLEVLLGSLLGLLAGLPGTALLGSAAHGASLFGLGGRASSWSALVTLTVLVAAFALDLHRPWLAAAHDVLVTWQVGAPSTWMIADPTRAWQSIAAMARTCLFLALAWATPLMLAGAIVDIATRLLARGMHPAAAFVGALRPWFRLALGLVALAASWSAVPEAWSRVLVMPVR
ncbi:MAG: hypothetical protein V3V08_12555 [Nannocystaceae bacterium]